jgi:acyl carrier protein
MKKKEIIDYISLNFLPIDIDLDENTDLFESGIIDSMGVIELVSFIEERYDVSLDAKQMSADNFKTVNSILSLIQKVDC